MSKFDLGGIFFNNTPKQDLIILSSENGYITDAAKLHKEALKEILTELEDKYMDLNMEIDNCQGCMDGLDEAFDKLKIYKELIRYLGGNIDKNYKEVLERWYSYRKEEERKQQEEKNKEPFKEISIPVTELILSNRPGDKFLWELGTSYNRISIKIE